MKQSALLMIDRQNHTGGSIFNYTLVRPPDNPLARPQAIASSRVVDHAVLSHLCNSIKRAIESAIASPGGPEVTWTPLVELGRALYETLMPGEDRSHLRREVRQLAMPLLISTDQGEVPWELLFDAEWPDFLGLRLQIGRRLPDQQERTWPAPRDGKEWRALLIADPAENLHGLIEEAAGVQKKLEQAGVTCTALERARATHGAVVNELVRPFDLIHYTGHVERGELVLNDSSLSAIGIAPLIPGAPVVFLNGCESASLQGTTGALLRGSTRAVIASMYKMTPSGGAEMASAFYEKALGGVALGEAVLHARRMLSPNPARGNPVPPSCGAAWACLVLYGEPALQLEISADELQASLRAIGLSRDDFDENAGTILQRAHGFSTGGGQLGSPHLFAAMVADPSQFVWKRLQKLRVPPEYLEKAFREVFAEGKAESPGQATAQLSESVQTVLRGAKESAKNGPITELDLVRGLVRSGGGITGKILEHLGVSIRRLDPDDPDRIGPLSETDCDSVTWAVLGAAVACAAKRSPPESPGALVTVNTTDIFTGLYLVTESGFAERLRRFGLGLALPDSKDTTPAEVHRSAVCSRNAENLLKLALADAQEARRKVAPQDLIGQFAGGNGGGMGSALEKMHLHPPLLTSALFLGDGSLDLSRFDEAGQRFLADAVRFGGDRGDKLLARKHLIYAMLCAEQSWLGDWVRQQNADPLLVADCIRSRIPADGGVPGGLKSVHFQVMAPPLTRALCRAEAGSPTLIEDRAFALALFSEGGGEAAVCLNQSGVRLPCD